MAHYFQLLLLNSYSAMYYLVTFIFLLLSGNGTFIAFYNIDWFIIDLIFIWVGIEYNRFHKSDFRIAGYFMLLYISYCTFRSLFLTHLPINYYISDIIYLFKYILPSMLFCAVLREKAIHYIPKVIIHLTIISIGFYCIQLVAGPMLYSIGNAIGIPPYVPVYHYTNFIVFTYVTEHAYQNSGFSWEPGAFGFFLNMGLLLHLLRNGFKLDKGAKWLILGIITTLSTTSYIALVVVFLLYFRIRGMKLSKLALFATPVLGVMVFELPFLADKIVDIYKHDMLDLKNIETLSAYYLRVGEEMPFNRFSSLIFLYNQFGPKLIFGVSNIYFESVPVLKNINISSGIFEFFAKFGLITFIVLLQRAYLFFKSFTYNTEQRVYCILLILVLGFSESIFLSPLMISFYFLYQYVKPEEVSDIEVEYIENETSLSSSN